MTKQEALLKLLEEDDQPEQPVRRDTMTREELAEYLKINLSTLKAHELQKKIPHMRIGRNYVFRKDVVDWYMLRETEKTIKDEHVAQEFKKTFLGGTQ